MSLSLLILLVLQCFMFAGLYILWIKFHKPQGDDPRLTRGLQLLQSKISVLEDLSDRTETQVNQLTALMENKIKEIQIKVIEADKIINAIEMNIHKSLEVAKIFQDKIPHKEIMERQHTIKYVKAAKLAHQGLSIEDISKEVDLTPGEIDLILKLNKENLMFEEDSLPEWINVNSMNDQNIDSKLVQNQWVDFEKAFELPKVDKENLKRLGDRFKEAVHQANEKNLHDSTIATEAAMGSKIASIPMNQPQKKDAIQQEAVNQKGKVVTVKPFAFKRIEQTN
ncbi:MAG: DUF2802 domain-containing protein [Bdellovibrionaceae bacterium]|nr:DUF2802 domain-containing protein [Pseudobdellovibrionaceae bacterium]